MRVKAVNDNRTWNGYLKMTKSSSFLNTLQFHKLWQESLGEKVWRRIVLENSAPYIIYNIVRKNLPFGFNFLFIPQGPLLVSVREQQFSSEEVLTVFFKDIQSLAAREKSLFIKIEPMEENGSLLKFLNQCGFIKSSYEIEPQYTTIVDLMRQEEEIYKSFHHKARYNIRLAQKHKVEARLIKNKAEANVALNLIFNTAKTKNFGIFPRNYFEKLILFNKGEAVVKIFVALFGEKIIASSINIIYNKKATYLFGGSDLNYRRLMAPYLLKWEEIKYFKKTGCRNYDLWGISDPAILNSDQNHSLKGVTQFKLKFNGEVVKRLGSYDYILKPALYKIYYFLKKYI